MEAMPYTVLLVEDHPGDARLIEEMLCDAGETALCIEQVDCLSRGLVRLSEGPVDAILLDLGLPDSQGIETFQRMHALVPTIPIVVLTGLNDDTVGLAAVQEGAQDYLVKGQIGGYLLQRALHYAIERQRLLEEIAAERTWLQTVVDRTPAAVVLFRGRPVEQVVLNHRAKELFGALPPSGAELARFFARVCHRPDGTLLGLEETCPERALRGEAIFAEERLLRSANGDSVPVLMSAGPIHDDAGAVVGAVAIVEDISTLKELEQLRKEWVSIIAHDLRQPVQIITGYAGLLAKTPTKPADWIKKQADQILTSAHRLERAIVDLLDASRIEVGQMTLQREAVDLAELMTTVVDRLATVIAEHALTIDVAEQLPCVEADPERLEQVLENLLSNAAKYGDAHGAIRIALTRRESDVAVAVTNRGPAIPSEEVPTLFDRFRRSRQARERGIDGLGLGLFISQGIVQAHGGRIWVESNSDQTTFHFTLPPVREGS